MKITKKDYEALRAVIKPLDTEANRTEYLKCGMSDERYRWDLLHASKFDTRPLYSYLNDSHIDTALRAVIKPLDTEANRCNRTL